MSDGSKSKGYTIVEVLIVIAVTSSLLLMSNQLISGQQAKTQFTQAVRNFESRLQQIANDVGTGYFPAVGHITCSAGGGSPPATPTVSSAPSPLGTSSGCVFAGQVVQFQSAGVSGDKSQYKIYTIVGNRQYSNALLGIPLGEAQSISQSNPVLPPDIATTENISNSIEVGKVFYNTAAGSPTTVGDIAFYNSFGQYSGGNLVSGTTSVNVSGFGSLGAIGSPNPTGIWTGGVNPLSGVIVCLIGPNNQMAYITVGSAGRRLTTDVQFLAGNCT